MKFISVIISAFVMIGVIFCPVGCSRSKNRSTAEKEQAFKELLHEWNVDWPVEYNVTHYKERSVRDGYGSVFRYFKLEVAEAQVQILLNNSPISKALNWNEGKGFLEIRPPIDWWKAGEGVKVIRGALLSDDNRQCIDLSRLLQKGMIRPELFFGHG